MAKYDIHFKWKLKVPVQDAWRHLFEIVRWPLWWKGVHKVEQTVAGFESGEGSLNSCVFKGPLFYKINFTLIVCGSIPLKRLESNLYGDITGSCKWEMEPDGEGTVLRCHFKVHDTHPLSYISSFLLAPLFNWNFRKILKSASKGMVQNS
jgi:hypothetical protein